MKAFVLTHNAKTDLRAIALFTQDRWGVEQRNLYIKQLDETFHSLGNLPALGNCCDEIMPGYRKFPLGSHVIYYKSGVSSVIEIIRILHKRMDVETQLVSKLQANARLDGS